MSFRRPIPDFQTANPAYVGATVSCFRVNEDGTASEELATLYANPRGAKTLRNPVILDGEGKFSNPVYIEDAIIMEIVSSNVGSHQTGIVLPVGAPRGEWKTGEHYNTRDFIRDPGSQNLFIASAQYVSRATIAEDIAAGDLVPFLDFDQVNSDAAGAALALFNARFTISTDPPSGGADGDVWLRIS